uniref:Uncharacterized protein n=1 Tax=Rousettus aegyptiacus TaxID=9407 RepID=A0A7J8E8P9_ROUAE|nr:hypothetical protein HJG63_008164 [Rousettus aegyptiacus]
MKCLQRNYFLSLTLFLSLSNTHMQIYNTYRELTVPGTKEICKRRLENMLFGFNDSEPPCSPKIFLMVNFSFLGFLFFVCVFVCLSTTNFKKLCPLILYNQYLCSILPLQMTSKSIILVMAS